jgi:hypothetical protein
MRNYTPQPGHLSSADAPVQIVAIVLVFSGQAQAHEPDVCKFMFADKHHPTDAWTRVFKPGHEILAQGLPEPEV